MRLATMASVAVLAVSSAALAQVASSPVEQKTSSDNVAVSDKTEGADNGALTNAVGNTADRRDDRAPAPTPPRPPRRR